MRGFEPSKGDERMDLTELSTSISPKLHKNRDSIQLITGTRGSEISQCRGCCP
jgi:hypothetical protein